MPNYCRIVSRETADRIRRERSIPPSQTQWEPYKPGEVVLLFDVDITPISYLVSVINEYLRDHGDHVVLLSFRYLGDVEADRSAAGWPGSFAHLGPIPIDDVMQFRMIEMHQC